MPTACDVAQYILEKIGNTPSIKLQKLVYYCQAWCLVWTNMPLFTDQIEAWANGPVIPNLYRKHHHEIWVDPAHNIGNSANLDDRDRQIVDSVLPTYVDKEAFWLVELTHLESPWKDARVGYVPGQVCTNEITHAAMCEYYSGLIR